MRIAASFWAATALAGSLVAVPAQAQQAQDPAAPSAQGDVSVTIYNADLAMIQDVRSIAIGSGRQQIELPDVSAQIQPQSVSFAAAGTSILEQNFDYSLLSPAALMNAAVGQQITLVRTNPATGAEVRERATVLATNGGTVLRIGDRIEVLRDDGLPVRVVFDGIPAGMRARPTLSITVQSTQNGRRPAALRYLTRGMNWQADYVAMYDEASGKLDMQGWVTLTNNSGTPYVNATTTLVAGTPTGVEANNGYNNYRPQPPRGRVTQAGTETADRERLGNFYLYPLPTRTTIASAQTKQVSFLDVQGVPATSGYQFVVNGFNSADEPEQASTAINFRTSADGGLGDALPAGTIRFYQRDRTGTAQFIGQSEVGHTPMGSTLSLSTGTAFNVRVKPTVVRREQASESIWTGTQRTTVNIRGMREITATSEYYTRRPYWRTAMRYTLTNAQPHEVTVELVQRNLEWRWDSTRVESEPQPGVTDREGERRWMVTVPANGSRDFDVTYVTRY